MNDRFTWADGDIEITHPGKKALATLVGRKYSDDQERDDHGRWTDSGGGGLATDGEPVQVSAEIEGMKSFAVMVDAMKAAEAIGYRQSPHMAEETEFGKFAKSLPGAQDPALALMAQEKGFDGQPKLVSPEEIDKLIAAGAPDLWRGVAGYNRENQPRYTGDEAAESLLKGDYYAGKGTYGDGIYFISSTDTDKSKDFPSTGDRMAAAVNFAGGYAGSDGAVVHATLPPDAKIADFDAIHQEATSLYNAAAYQQGDEDSHEAAVRHILFDDGRYAMAKGYDAIKVSAKETGTSPFYVILNRSALIAEDKAYPVKTSSDYVITSPELRERVRMRPDE